MAIGIHPREVGKMSRWSLILAAEAYRVANGGKDATPATGGFTEEELLEGLGDGNG